MFLLCLVFIIVGKVQKSVIKGEAERQWQSIGTILLIYFPYCTFLDKRMISTYIIHNEKHKCLNHKEHKELQKEHKVILIL
jgi:hypothetical protein